MAKGKKRSKAAPTMSRAEKRMSTMSRDEIREVMTVGVAVEDRPLNRAQRRALARMGEIGGSHLRPLARLSEDGEVGYYADPVRWDDCLRAAIATALQIPPEQIPDPRLHARLNAGDDPDEISDESWLRIAEWAERRGLQMMLHEEDEVPADRERWIGVCVYTPRWDELWQMDEPNPFGDHCLVMSYDRVIFEPAARAIVPRGMELQTWDASEVTYGISFDPREKE